MTVAIAVLVLLGQTGVAAAAVPAPGELLLVSASSAGEPGNSGSSYGVSTSADGRYVAFASMATNLDPADQDMVVDVFVKDLSTGGLRLVSQTPDGVKGNQISDGPAISADGQIVAFVSASDNLSPDDTDGYPDVFVKNLSTGELTVASRTGDGTKAEGGAWAAALAADGSTVAFASKAGNLSPDAVDGESHVYVKRLDTGSLTLVDGGVLSRPDEQSGAGDPALSADGDVVAFTSDAEGLDPADTDRQSDIYLRDLGTGSLSLASVNVDGVKGDSPSGSPSVSGDGTRVAFQTASANLVPQDTDETSDIYVKNIVDGTLVLASTDESGNKANLSADYPALSEDGNYLAFSTDATNFGLDTPVLVKQVYRKDLVSGELLPASVAADGTPGDYLSIGPTIAGDGSVVAFYTPSTNLVDDGGNRMSDVLAKVFTAGQPPADTAAPTVQLAVSTPWLPGNRGTRHVSVTGSANDDTGLASITFAVVDEYGSVEPEISPVDVAGDTDSTWRLQTALSTTLRRGDPCRVYTITATATDLAGNVATSSTQVVVVRRASAGWPLTPSGSVDVGQISQPTGG